MSSITKTQKDKERSRSKVRTFIYVAMPTIGFVSFIATYAWYKGYAITQLFT